MISTKTQKLCISALMAAIATVLSFLKIWEMPFGGSVTLFSMVPLAFLSYRYGVKWGVATAAVFSVLQLLFGVPYLIGNDLLAAAGIALLDYVAAYTVIGCSGMFRRVIKTPVLSVTAGFLVATFCRYLIHVLSGWIFFRSYAEDYFRQENFALGAAILEHINGPALGVVYSFVYNIFYILPDMLFAAIGLVLLSVGVRRLMQPAEQ